MEKTYLKIKEECDWEGETWIHFVRVTGNEPVIERIVKLIKRYGRDLGIVAIKGHKTEEYVRQKCLNEDDDCGYMAKYGMNDRILDISLFDGINRDNFDSRFYKGRAREWGETEKERQAEREAAEQYDDEYEEEGL